MRKNGTAGNAPQMGGIRPALGLPRVPSQAEIIQRILNQARGTSPDGGIGPGNGGSGWYPHTDGGQDWAAHGGNEKGYKLYLQGHVDGPRPGQINLRTGELRPYPPRLSALARQFRTHFNLQNYLTNGPDEHRPGRIEPRLARWMNKGKIASIDETGITRAPGPSGRTHKIAFIGDAQGIPETVAGLQGLNTLRGNVRGAVGRDARLAAKQAFGQAAVDFGLANRPTAPQAPPVPGAVPDPTEDSQLQFQTMLQGLGMGGMT